MVELWSQKIDFLCANINMIRSEILSIIVMVAPSPLAFRAMQMAGQCLRLTPTQQFMVRARYRQLERAKSSIWCVLPNGKSDGVSILLNNDRSLYCRYYCANGMRHGMYCTLYESGRVQRLCSYRHGVIFGISRIWYRNGQLSEEYQYVDGKKQGMYQAWYESGQLNIRSTYECGEFHGSRWAWHKNGVMHMHAEYEHGLKHGVQQYWRPDGSVSELFTWFRDHPRGDYKMWDASGTLVTHNIYDWNNDRTIHVI